MSADEFVYTEEMQERNQRIIERSDERLRALFAHDPVQVFPGTGRIDPRSIPGLMDGLATSDSPFAPVLGNLVDDMIERFGGGE